MLSADAREPAKAREYRELMDIINRRGDHGSDKYQELMQKETRVLDTVDRVINDSRLQTIKRTNITEMSIMQIISRTAEVVHDIYLELFTVRSLQDAKDVFVRSDRIVYLGIIVTMIGFFIGFIQLSGTSDKTSASSSVSASLPAQQWLNFR